MFEIYIVIALWIIPMVLSIYLSWVYFTSLIDYHKNGNDITKSKHRFYPIEYLFRIILSIIPVVNVFYLICHIADISDKKDDIDHWLFKKY